MRGSELRGSLHSHLEQRRAGRYGGPVATDDTLKRWHDAVRAKRLPDDFLADDAVFRSPAVHRPQEGAELTSRYLQAALVVLGPTLAYQREWIAENSAVLEFTADLDGIAVHGVDMITWGEDGKVTEFTVMVRPVKGLHALIERMAAELTREATA